MRKNDNFALWAIAGTIGVIIRDGYSFVAKQVGFADFYIWKVGADIFLEGSEMNLLTGTILGFLNDLVIGGMLGIFMGLLFEWRGLKHYLIKGMGIGLMAWIFFFGILFHNLPNMTTAPKSGLSSISAFIGHSIFGFVTAWIIKRYMIYETEDVKQETTIEENKEKKKLKLPLVPVPARKSAQHSNFNGIKKPIKLIRLKRFME